MAKSDFNYVFKRNEKKYLLTLTQYEELMLKLKPYMQVDNYGLSLISNIYYDTKNFDLIRRSTEKPVYKEKLRLRSYGVPENDSTVFIEIKKKYNGTVYKRRISLSLKDAVDYLNNGIKPKGDSQILREIDYFISFHKPEAKVYLSYKRIAMFGISDNRLRITFDSDILSRDYDLDLSKGPYGKSLLPENCRLMEIKIAGAMPLWLVKALDELEIKPISFSKYGTVYKNQQQKV